MKKKISTAFILLLMFFAAATAVYLLSRPEPVIAQVENISPEKLLKELQREQQVLEKERQRLQQYEVNLKNFQAEVEKQYDEYRAKAKKLQEMEEAFNKKLQTQLVDRQTIETYESIDPEQAAILVKNLYLQDNEMTAFLMRKLSGKKAGKILEAMIPIDKEVATKLAKESLDYFKPDLD